MKTNLSLTSSEFTLAYSGLNCVRNSGICCLCYSFKIVSKKTNTKQSSSSPQGPELPPRITTNLKQNLTFLKLWKEFQRRKSSTPKPATSYRRKKVEKEILPEDTEVYRDPTLTLY
ncbi:hypothetical protein Leryth_004263 [Lithospermum erythrorhizon]|nr:hypothetical protein Leryth_004263 [Lithospermum erythrorhizon]